MAMQCAVCKGKVEMKDAFVLPALVQVEPNAVPDQPVACSAECLGKWFKSERGMTLEEMLEAARQAARQYDPTPRVPSGVRGKAALVEAV